MHQIIRAGETHEFLCYFDQWSGFVGEVEKQLLRIAKNRRKSEDELLEELCDCSPEVLTPVRQEHVQFYAPS